MKLDYSQIRPGCFEVTCQSNPSIKFWSSSTKTPRHLLQAVLSHTNNKLSPEELDEMNNKLDELEALYEERYGKLEETNLAHREASQHGIFDHIFGITRGKPGDRLLEQLGDHEEESKYKEATRDDYSVLEYTSDINQKNGDSLLQSLGGE